MGIIKNIWKILIKERPILNLILGLILLGSIILGLIFGGPSKISFVLATVFMVSNLIIGAKVFKRFNIKK